MLNEEPKTQTSHTGPSDNDPVSQLLSTLKRVEAPGDFEFRVRAGIAERNSIGGRYAWLPATWKLASPLALLLLLGGYFGIGSLYPPAANDPQLVAETQPADVPLNVSPAAVIEQPSEASVVVPTNEIVADNIAIKPIETGNKIATTGSERRVTVRSETAANGSGSFDEASRESRTIFLHDQMPNNSDNAGKIDVRSVLSMIGINASYTPSGWVVNSVSGSTIAGRSGVRAGDVIEAINGQVLGSKTSFGSSFTGHNLRVRREGKSMQITLR